MASTRPVHSPPDQVTGPGATSAKGLDLSESDTDREETDLATRQTSLPERRRLQNAKFKSWFSSRAEKIIKEDPTPPGEPLDDEKQSTKDLVAKQESRVIITDPREYQLELFERAKQQNVIAVLDTGSGKTLIAVLLLKHTIDEELENRGFGKPPRISFFLVDCVTLVFQQFAVLECNLDQKIARFCGDMIGNLWEKEPWKRHFSENMVIVCTAEILYQCLIRGFISMERINLLVFDEAHHAKKNHPYARIIREFYLCEDNVSKRPKVFGMTASPVDAKVDVITAAKELEMLLHCQIATASDVTLLRRTVHRPDEKVGAYDALALPFDTTLCRLIRDKAGRLDALSKTFETARLAASELGPWCADQIWSFALGQREGRNLERKMEQAYTAKPNRLAFQQTLEESLAQLQEARDVVLGHDFTRPEATSDYLSAKVLLLQRYLNNRFERPTDDKCIVFVQKRYTAKVLEVLFKDENIGTPHLRAGCLIGARSGSEDAADLSTTFRRQVVTLTRFRKGQLNCLFATSIAEEGLDIPDCNVVIRFDLYTTMIQYIQSRGRARHANSQYLHMIEKGNVLHLDTLREVRQGEGIMRRFCESLPADRLLLGNDDDLEEALSKDQDLQEYTEKETGAKLTYGSSLVVLAHFVSSLRYTVELNDASLTMQQAHGVETVYHPSYAVSARGKGFICEVILPESSPIRSAIGRLSARKSIAKRSAAFEACLALRKGKYLDSNLLPIYKKQLPAMRNAQLDLGLSRSSVYDIKTKPSLWANSIGQTPTVLFLTVFELANPAGLGRPYQPLGLLTRCPMPGFPPFVLHFRSGSTSQLICTSVTSSLQIAEDDMDKIDTFTLRIFQDLFNKIYESDTKQMPYWLVPIVSNLVEHFSNGTSHIIDWEVLRLVHEKQCLEWTSGMSDSFWVDRFLMDPHDGGTRYFSVRVAPEFKPLDPVPSGVPRRRIMDNILQYSNSLFKGTRQKATWSLDQPVVMADLVMHRHNWLDVIDDKERNQPTKCFIYPEPLKMSALPTSIVAMAYMFPAVLFRLESYLIALELSHKLGLDIKLEYALEAITKDSHNTEMPRDFQIEFQRGMGGNYERLEFLGDCFLKMATSISLYTLNPDKDEFEYHVKRMLLICNKNLRNTAVSRKIYEHIRTKGFQRRIWYPEEPKLLQGKATHKGTIQQSLGDKSLADICEAVIGAALLSHHDTGNFDQAVRAVTEMVNSPDHKMMVWDDYYKLYNKPAFQVAKATSSQLDLSRQIGEEAGYYFRYPRLLRSAFIHPSYPYSWENIPCYQRLEFLGDSLLDLACVNHLYHRYPAKDPQWLTEHKMAMVSNQFLGAACVKLGFHKHIRYNSAPLECQIREYVTEIQEAENVGDGSPDYWVSSKAPPKALPDIVEAYIGAIFVDSEYNFHEVEKFFDAHIKHFFEDMNLYDSYANSHPTTALNNLLTVSLGCDNFRLLAREVPGLSAVAPPQVLAAVMVHDDVIAEGRAPSARTARVRASEHASAALKGLSPTAFRRQYRCDCVAVAAAERMQARQDAQDGAVADGNDLTGASMAPE